MRIRCLLGWHEYGKQYNIRAAETKESWTMMFLPVLLMMIFFPPKECERKCVHCGKEKTFLYDGELGE